MVQLMGICSCQAIQPFSPWPLAWAWFGFIRSLCGFVNTPLRLLLQTLGEDPSFPPAGVRETPALTLQVLERLVSQS